MPYLSRLLAPLAALFLLAGCGGSSHHSAHVRIAPLKIARHTCTPQNTALQCVLAKQPEPNLQLSFPFSTRLGWDFAWSCPSPSGRAFGASYLSWSSKDWTPGCINWYHSNGAGTVFVWETAATRATDGYSAGAADARSASSELQHLGQPAGQPFTMAIDFDASGSDVASYFAGASAAEPGRVNAYGGYRPLLYLYDRHLVGHLNWQTYAWSGGSWLPASIAPLEQYLNSSAVDYDRAIAADYGQSPRPGPVGPSAAQVRRWIAERGSSLHAYYAGFHRGYGCHQPVLTSGYCGQHAWRVDHFQKLVDTAHGYYPHCFGARRNLGAAECQIVRRAVATWTGAVNSTVKGEGHYGCESARGPVRNRTCDALRAREAYFRARINRTLSTSRL